MFQRILDVCREFVELDFLVEFEVLQLLHFGLGLFDLEYLVFDLVDLVEHVGQAGVDDLHVVLLAVELLLQLVVVVLDVFDQVVLLTHHCLEVLLQGVHLADSLVQFLGDLHVLVPNCLLNQFLFLVVVTLVPEVLLDEVPLLQVGLVVEEEDHEVDASADLLLVATFEDLVEGQLVDVVVLRVLEGEEAFVRLQLADEGLQLVLPNLLFEVSAANDLLHHGDEVLHEVGVSLGVRLTGECTCI